MKSALQRFKNWNRQHGSRVFLSTRREERLKTMETPMSDPRYTDPRTNPRQNDPALGRRSTSEGALWGWIAAIAVLVLIAFVFIAGWNRSANNTASTTSTAPVTTGAAPSGNVPANKSTTAPTPAQPSSPPATNGAK